MWIFVFHTKNNGFSIVLNSQLQGARPTSRRAPNFKARAHARPRAPRRDAPTATAHFLNEILKMLTVEAYRKDIL
jgi:hypothetical protein